MHVVTLADLASTLAKYGPNLLSIRKTLAADAILKYWTASRNRHELWHRAMRRHRDAKNSLDLRELHRWWDEHVVLLEEILVSELLARVVAAIGSENFRCEDDPEDHAESFAAITHGVFLAQMEASNRVHQIILEVAGAPVSHRVRLNRLRYGVQRWVDWLIGRVSVQAPRGFAYCIEQDRARTFSEEVRENASNESNDLTTWLMNAAMRDMLVRRTSPISALPQANQEVATAVLMLFRPDLFDDYGVPKSLWLQRLQRDGVSDVVEQSCLA